MIIYLNDVAIDAMLDPDQRALVMMAILRHGAIVPCQTTGDVDFITKRSFSIYHVDGEYRHVMWYNDTMGSTHIVQHRRAA